MPVKLIPYSELSRSGKYYRYNAKARDKKKKTDTKINQRPDQRKKRSILSTLRRRAKKRGLNLAGKDLSHTKKGIVLKSIKANRGSKSDTAGDRRARCKKALRLR